MEDFIEVTSKKDAKQKYQKKTPSSQGSDASARGGHRGGPKKQQYKEDEEMKGPQTAAPVTMKRERSDSHQMKQKRSYFPSKEEGFTGESETWFNGKFKYMPNFARHRLQEAVDTGSDLQQGETRLLLRKLLTFLHPRRDA